MMLSIDPPLLNSANVWATTEEELEAYYHCEHTGAITIRTSLLDGFRHDDEIHQYCFFDVSSGDVQRNSDSLRANGDRPNIASSSLNTLGYSPVPLKAYVDIVRDIELRACKAGKLRQKKVIFSVTGSVQDVLQCHKVLRMKVDSQHPAWMMEINLSCPNIPSQPPPAYSKASLLSYLTAIQNTDFKLPIGIKTPPYTYQGQFDDLISALLETTLDGLRCPISFITATNTLGNCLMLDSISADPAIQSSNGTGIGGLAGPAIHSLALGNVRNIRRMLDQHPSLKDIGIIGVGGVSDAAGFNRMMKAGACAVALGTALGIHGISIFGQIADQSRAHRD